MQPEDARENNPAVIELSGLRKALLLSYCQLD